MRDMSVFTSQLKKIRKWKGAATVKFLARRPPSLRYTRPVASNPSPGYGTLSFVDDANL